MDFDVFAFPFNDDGNKVYYGGGEKGLFRYFMEDYLSPFMSVLFCFFILSGGMTFSSFIISYSMENNSFYDHPLIEEEEDYEDEDDEDDEEPEIPYEYKYVKEFEELIENPLLVLDSSQKLNLSNSVLMETTPLGDVVMFYEYDNDVPERSKFVYYSTNRSIPYKYLDAVARKYVYVYKCPDIYVYIKDELTKVMKRMEEEKKQDEVKQAEEIKKNSVFASFKNYKNPTVKSRHILVTKNKYKHMGSIEDYEKSLLPKEEQSEVKPISFSQFKQMTNSG